METVSDDSKRDSFPSSIWMPWLQGALGPDNDDVGACRVREISECECVAQLRFDDGLVVHQTLSSSSAIIRWQLLTITPFRASRAGLTKSAARDWVYQCVLSSLGQK